MGQTGQGKVIVVGAGPTGLMLAAELALAGVDCLVLERATRAAVARWCTPSPPLAQSWLASGTAPVT